MKMGGPRSWRLWILGWVFVALLGIQLIESTHHHDSAALEAACAVCQVAAHHALDVPPPPTAPLVAVLFFLFLIVISRQPLRVGKAPRASYYSRAPPYLAA